MRALILFLLSLSFAAAAPKESDFYTITSVPIPKHRKPEITSIEFISEDTIAISTRRGDIFTSSIRDSQYRWKLFAEGLHEPLGLSYKDGWLFATQRPEVTRMKDNDGDGRADTFETVNSDWGINGDYHEYAFGSRHDSSGNIWVALCLSGSSKAASDYRGWCLRITPDGNIIPTASGVRSPGGIGANAEGDFFYTDNQGFWNGSSSLKHLKPGGFMGNPAGNKFYSLTHGAIGNPPPTPESGSRIEIQRKRIPQLVPPAVIFPHAKMGQSPAGIELDSTSGKFGPFEGQLFVTEQTHSQIQRVFLEEINGVYQGAVFHFLKGFPSGNISVRFAPDGTLFTGGTNRGWGARGGKSIGLSRIKWTGDTPSEIKEMRATAQGFDLTFTTPIDTAQAENIANYQFRAFTYIYQEGYGSPEVDESNPTVTAAESSADGLTVSLQIEGLVKGHVHQLDVSDTLGLLHSQAFYTLNEIPGRN